MSRRRSWTTPSPSSSSSGPTPSCAATPAPSSRCSPTGFSFVGPAGFILDKQQWLGRFSERGLRYTSFRWTDLRVTDHDAVTIVVGVQEQEGDHQGRDISGRFRGTLVVIGADGGQRIAAMQLSPIMAPPGA
jgi:hypothetical protein